MKTIHFIGCLLLVFLIPGFTFGEVSFSVTPTRIDLTLRGGQTGDIEMSVLNRGNRPLQIRTQVMDFELNRQGEVILREPGSLPQSCAGWISPDKEKFHLEPGEQKSVIATIKVPRGTQGGRYAAILFQTGPVPAPREANLLVSGRLGTLAMLSVPRTLKRSGEIVEFSVQKWPENKVVEFSLVFKNTGNVHVSAGGTVVIIYGKNRVVARIPMAGGTGTVLPGGMREYRAVWKDKRKMTPGNYTAQARVQFPGGAGVRAERSFVLDE